MDTRPVESKKAKRTGYIIFFSVVITFLVYYAVISALGASGKAGEILSEYAPEVSVKETVNEKTYTDSTYLSILKEKAWLQAKTVMAQTDSIYMAINLADSLSEIEISGVAVHAAKISKYRLSRLLREGDRNAILTMFSQPLTINNSLATIRKEPLMIKIAPKDTSEYQPDIIPDTSIVEHVNFILELSNGMRVYVYQDEVDRPLEKGSTFRFDLKDRLNNAWSSMKSAALLRVPEYHPYIKIWIPREDVKIIYRALPRNGQIAVYT